MSRAATTYTDPFRDIYQETDFQISQRDEIQEVYDQLQDISETTTGDCDAKHYALQYKVNKYSYIISGAIAWKVRLNGSYKQCSLDFKSYCKDEFGCSYSKIRREMIASRVGTDLIRMGFDVLPACVSGVWQRFVK